MSSDSDRAPLSDDELLAEMDALRAENGRLRGLLGLDERPDGGHAHAWAPTLLSEPTDTTVGGCLVDGCRQARIAVVVVRGTL
ncbi:MAG: hypothetical protein ABW364_15585 [Rhodococcus fascians]